MFGQNKFEYNDYICSKMFTDLIVRIPDNTWKYCCKTTTQSSLSDEGIDKDDPLMFFNDPRYVKDRHDMIDKPGLPAPSCNVCIDTGTDSFYKWRNEIEHHSANGDRPRLKYEDNLRTLTVKISTSCDLKCLYCHPDVSSMWAKERKPSYTPNLEQEEFLLNKFYEYLGAKNWNPTEKYRFTIQGGEPMMISETIPSIRHILTIARSSGVPDANLMVMMSTNANAKESIVNKYLQLVEEFPEVRWHYSISFDAVGSVNDAIRHNSKWATIDRNFTRFLILSTTNSNVKVTVNPAMSLYNLPHMAEYMKYIRDLTQKLGIHSEKQLRLSYNFVAEFGFSPASAPAEYAVMLDPAIKIAEDHNFLQYAEAFRSIRNLVGTRVSYESMAEVEKHYNYFKDNWTGTDWNGLFPHIPEMIANMKTTIIPSKTI